MMMAFLILACLAAQGLAEYDGMDFVSNMNLALESDDKDALGEDMEQSEGHTVKQKDYRVYYINLDSDTERRDHMEEQAAQAGMRLRRFPAIDRADIATGSYDEKYVLAQGLKPELLLPERAKDHVRNATVACYVSHNELLEEIHSDLFDTPDEVAVVLEDDVQIPHDWRRQLEKTLNCAPKDWSLLKVSGWGYTREEDRWQPPGSAGGNHTADASDGLSLMSWLQKQGGWMSKIFYGEPVKNNSSEHLLSKNLMRKPHSRSSFLESAVDSKHGASISEVGKPETCPEYYRMRLPFTEQQWWHFWGPAFHYAGTGAYVVKASQIPKILAHLRSQRISDVDGMLLTSPGEEGLKAFEQWPHVFPLAVDHVKSTMLATDQSKGLTGSLLSAIVGERNNDSSVENFTSGNDTSGGDISDNLLELSENDGAGSSQSRKRRAGHHGSLQASSSSSARTTRHEKMSLQVKIGNMIVGAMQS